MKDGASIGPRLGGIALILAVGLGGYGLGKRDDLFTAHANEAEATPPSPAADSSPSQSLPSSRNGHGTASPQTKTTQELEALAREILESGRNPTLVLQDLKREWRQRLLRLGAGDLADLNRILNEMKPERFSYQARGIVATAWATLDGPAALAGLEEEEAGRNWIPEALAAWAATDLRAAVAWLWSKQERFRGEDGPVAFTEDWERLPYYLLASYAAEDRGFFEEKLREANPDKAKEIFTACAFKWWRDPAMRDWLGELSLHHEGGESFRRELARTWGQEDPQAAIAYISSREMPAEDKLKAEAAAANAHGHRDPRAALDGWMQRHGEFHPDLSATVESWAQKSPDEALRWVAALADETRREALYTYVISGGFGESWINWRSCGPMVRSIQDPVLRRDALRRLDRLVAERAPDELAEWRANLPEAERAALGE